MEWEFRKVLDTFESYRNNSQYYVSQIQKGSPGILKTLVRELQIIISKPKQSKIAKVLAMRFAKQIMILGREDVINELTKLVPHILKICSHRLESEDPNRGETIFYDDIQYIEGSEDHKKDLEVYGSTYFTLCLQSIYHWAKWIPMMNQNREQSIYLRSYNTLLERGVKFQPIFHYYKNSDAQKFKKTYKVQFFPDSSFDLNSNHQSSRQSFLSESGQTSNEVLQYMQQMSYEQLKQNVQMILTSHPELYNNSNETQKFVQKQISKLEKEAINIYSDNNFINKNIKGNKKQKIKNQWLDKFIILSKLFQNKKITIGQFTDKLFINQQYLDVSQDQERLLGNQQNINSKNGIVTFKKISSAKRQGSNQSIKFNDEDKLEKILRQQQDDYRRKIDNLLRDLQDKEEQLKNMQNIHKQDMISMKNQYEDRINLIKKGVTDMNYAKEIGSLNHLTRQNQALKNRIKQLYQQNNRNNLEYSEESIRKYQEQIAKLLYDNEKLKKQNKKISSSYNDIANQNHKNISSLQKIQELENKLGGKQFENNEYNNQKSKDKKIDNLGTELYLYKNQLSDERDKFTAENKKLLKKVKQFQEINSIQKQEIYHLQKKLDLQGLQISELTEQVRLCKLMAQQPVEQVRYNGQDQRITQAYGSQEQINKQIYQRQERKKRIRAPKIVQFTNKKYQNLRNIFADKRQNYLRFARCSLKKKDILQKQNELEIGTITEVISLYETKMVIYFTNLSSEHQIENIKIQFANDSNIQLECNCNFIFCIQRQQQQKIVIKITNRDILSEQYQIISLKIIFKRKQKNYQYKIPLPCVLYKTMETYKVQSISNSTVLSSYQQSLSLNYSRHIISDFRILENYFPGISEYQNKKYICDIYQRDTQFLARLKMQFSGQNYVIIQLCPIAKQSSQPNSQLKHIQQKMMYDLIGFLEFVFKK